MTKTINSSMKEVNIWRTPYKAKIPKEIFEDVKTKHPNKEISVSFNTSMELCELSHLESVCWGDGKTFIFILTSK